MLSNCLAMKKLQNSWTVLNPLVTLLHVAGMTVAIADIKVPSKTSLARYSGTRSRKITPYYRRGLITEEERYRKTIQLGDSSNRRCYRCHDG